MLVSSESCGNGMVAGDLPQAVMNDLPEANLTGNGWTYIHNERYAYSTQYGDVRLKDYAPRCAFVGCKARNSDDSFRVGALVGAQVLLPSAPSVFRGVYWYHSFWAFGFSDACVVAEWWQNPPPPVST